MPLPSPRSAFAEARLEERQGSRLRQVARVGIRLVGADEAVPRAGIGVQLGRRALAFERCGDRLGVRKPGARQRVGPAWWICACVRLPGAPMPSSIGAKNSTSTFTRDRSRRHGWPPREKPGRATRPGASEDPGRGCGKLRVVQRNRVGDTMTTSLEVLEAEALKLAPADRSHLLERLIASLDTDPEVEEAWELEADRREASLESGSVTEVPAQEAMNRLRSRLAR